MAWVWVDDEDGYEPNWQPVPGAPEWKYDANQGEYRVGMSLRGGLAADEWRVLWGKPFDAT